jgi:hypothetical protein
METYAQYLARMRQELADKQAAITAAHDAKAHARRADWLERKIREFDDANAMSETELQLLIKFAEWIKEGAS